MDRAQLGFVAFNIHSVIPGREGLLCFHERHSKRPKRCHSSGKHATITKQDEVTGSVSILFLNNGNSVIDLTRTTLLDHSCIFFFFNSFINSGLLETFR